MTDSTKKPDTASRLRGDIDAGRGRDKVAYPDPAAAPLGTDDEAAGTPVTEEQAQIAREREIRDSEAPDTDQARTAGGTGEISARGADRTSEAETDPAVASTETGWSGPVKVAIAVIIALVVLFLIVQLF